MGSKTATQSRNAKRQADTAALMEAIRTGGEISKKREAELQKAADSGRGIQFIEGSPTVKGLTQKGGKPVFRTGATAEDYTGRIVASAPTFSELLGDARRALVGGTADKQVFTLPTSRPGTPTMDFANMVPDPRSTQGMIPALINTGGLGGLALNIIQDLYGKGKNFFFPEEEEEDTFSSAADAIGGAAAMSLGDIRTQKNLAGTTADEIDQFIRTIGQPNVDPFSSGADATRPVNTTDRYSSAADAMGGAGVDLSSSRPPVYELGNNMVGLGPELRVFNPKQDFMYPEDYTLPFTDIQIPSLGRAIESVVTGGQGSLATMDLTPAGQAYYDSLIEQGMSPIEAEQQVKVLAGYGYKEGGLTDTVPPEEGPMSAGVASLFKNK